MVSCLGSLVQSCCGREEHCKQMSLACVGSTLSVSATLSVSTLLRLQAALQGVGPELRALPRSKQLWFRFWGTPQSFRLGWACILCCSPVQAAQTMRCLMNTLSSGAVQLIPSPVPASVFGHAWSGMPCVSSGELIPA